MVSKQLHRALLELKVFAIFRYLDSQGERVWEYTRVSGWGLGSRVQDKGVRVPGIWLRTGFKVQRGPWLATSKERDCLV